MDVHKITLLIAGVGHIVMRVIGDPYLRRRVRAMLGCGTAVNDQLKEQNMQLNRMLHDAEDDKALTIEE